ncbi:MULTISPECIES: DUF1657 domain-containing protein [Clostridium]|uniref:DUF1657 domain-containing protein n=4 Tax=Clostridium TaxID=1485 RepID=A0A168LA08_9CLOT|nr:MULTISPECIES: DUF1657 domain-containing protein [Clostridium]ADK15151.1 conserved hypothetical protein [Clostridium ljungdahlii DSM 13528]AGY74409.1 DUF1657 domain-containing protein [Clostridium autoethanogenum DSM 10061]ALU34596.1 hypothetical protein CLAU_0167 [Clostridium autoethanogenum DSM 10061]OAA82869.1 hypothetical protein WY13_03937 [Clostridium ljungdahlii]OAA88628.1 hypothetical protein WX45_02562 [Clostridium ljungdahlii DSM 13528]
MTVGSQVKQTLAVLKGAESTLRVYSLQEQDKKVKNVYKEALDAVDGITKNLNDRLKYLEYEEPQYKQN